MDITSFQTIDLTSLKQALNIAALRESLNQNQAAVTNLVKGMEETTAKTLEQSLMPHLGGSIDIKL